MLYRYLIINLLMIAVIINGGVINIDSGNYTLLGDKRTVEHSDNVYRRKNTMSMDFPVVFNELNFEDGYALDIIINSYESELIEPDLGIGYYIDSTDTAGQNWPPKAITIGARGIKRKVPFSVMEICPVYVHNDSLFIMTSIDYTLTDYIIPPEFKNTSDQDFEKIDMIIITDESFVDEFELYKKFKTKQGLKTKIKTVQEIYTEYQGESEVLKIRNFIKDKYYSNNLKYVIIGGGYKIVPVGKTNPADNLSMVSTDIFYSNFDSELDPDNDGKFGEYNEDIDLYRDVFVGRFPGNTEKDISNIINKNIMYYSENRSYRNGFNTSLFTAGFDVYTDDDGMEFCRNINKEFPERFTIDSLYENTSPDFNAETILNKFDTGFNIIYTQSHGDKHLIRQLENNFKIWSDQIYTTHAPSGLYMLCACEPGYIGGPSLSYKAMTSPSGGSVTYIGSSGEEYPLRTNKMNAYFFKEIFEGKDYGESLNNSLVVMGSLKYNSIGSYLAQSYTIQGDPSNRPLLREPKTVNISGIGQFLKGSGSVSVMINSIPNDSVTYTLTSNDSIVGSTKTNSQSFTIEYEGLNSDSVYLHYHSPEVFLKTSGYKTRETQDVELKLTALMPSEDQGNGIVEHGENFSIGFDLKNINNPGNADSIIVKLENIKDQNITVLNDSVKVLIPGAGSSGHFDVFDLEFASPDSVRPDSSATADIVFSTTDGKEIIRRELYIPVTVPYLELTSFVWDQGNLYPMFLNSSKGSINKAEIQMIRILKNYSEKKEILKEIITLNNIPGYHTVKDSVFFSADTTDFYKFVIQINDDMTYYSNEFSINYSDTLQISLYADHSYESINLEWDHTYGTDVTCNVYSSSDPAFSNPEKMNFENIVGTSFSFDNNGNELFVRIGLIDQEGFEFALSDIVNVKPLELYGGTTYNIGQYELFNPVYHDGKLISNSRNSSVSAIDSYGNPVNGDGIIHNADPIGFSGTFQQGYAIGDVNGDGNADMVNYSYNVGDSVLVKVIDLGDGSLISSKKIYGHIMENAPVLVDLDLDGDKEILISVFNGNKEGPEPKGGYVYALDHGASGLLIIPGYPLYSPYSSYYIHSPSVIDLDNNGTRELIFDNLDTICIYNAETTEKIIDYDGPAIIQTSLSFCDIDNDGIIEIFSVTESPGRMYCYNFNGTTLVEKPGAYGGKSLDMKAQSLYDLTAPVNFADIEDDGDIEIISLTASKLYMFDTSFSNVPGFPVDLDPRISKNNMSAPAIADLDGDGNLDILFMDANYRIWAYSGISGQLLPHFPVKIEDIVDRAEMPSPAVADLDNDGDLEFAVGVKDGVMVVYDYPLQTSSRPVFDNYRGDPANTGLYEPLKPAAPVNISILDYFGDIIISWDPVTGADSYRVYASDEPYGSYELLGETANTSYTITNPLEKLKFYYIKAVK